MKYSDEQIIEDLNKNYEDVDNKAYSSALMELRELKPSEDEQDMKINVEFIKNDFDKNDKTEYLECDGLGLDKDGTMTRWGIEFSRWEDLLATDIDNKCLNTLDELTILTGILWEITYNGFTQKAVSSRKDDLMARVKESEEHPENLIPLASYLSKYKPKKGIDKWYIEFNTKEFGNLLVIDKSEELKVMEFDTDTEALAYIAKHLVDLEN